MSHISTLAKNRTEELGYDIWEQFVIPPYFNKLDLHIAKKPRIILGGRGCGKTMLLRYFSHPTQFSQKRTNLDFSAVEGIGLYWKVDSQYARAMHGRKIPDYIWENAFQSYSVSIIALEIVKSIESIIRSSVKQQIKDNITKLNFSGLKVFTDSPINTLEEFKAFIVRTKQEFDVWLVNPDENKTPRFLPKPFLIYLIEVIKSQCPEFEKKIFHVYIDEFENLKHYQQELLNTWLKHSEDSLMFNFAVKRNAFKISQTHSYEAISAIHDYSIHDIEKYTLESEYQMFASEIFLNNLSINNILDVEINSDVLKDSNRVHERFESTYKENIISQMNSIFPSMDNKEVARVTIENKTLLKQIKKRLEKALSYKKIPVDSIDIDTIKNNQVKIIIPYLVARDSASLKDILNEIELLNDGKENKFLGNGGWIDNIFIDCLLDIYEPFNRACPVYSGFKVFTQLSHGNLRNFLEICYKCLVQAKDNDNTFPGHVDPLIQAEGVKSASQYLLNEIKKFGDDGNKLHMFINRLGHLFSVNRRRPTKSRTEVIQFALSGGTIDEGGDIKMFLDEAIKHSVLLEFKGSQRFNQDNPEMINYMLNPIYSPYFLISYNRRKRLDIRLDDLTKLINGSLDEYKELVEKYKKSFIEEDGESSQYQYELFDNL